MTCKWQQEGGVHRAVLPLILSLIRCWLVGIKGKQLSYHIGLGRENVAERRTRKRDGNGHSLDHDGRKRWMGRRNAQYKCNTGHAGLPRAGELKGVDKRAGGHWIDCCMRYRTLW